MTLASANRVVFVHAHPDDETITTGSTIAALRAADVDVHVVTATRGEQGEVLVPELKHLEQHRDALGTYRAGELAAACAALDVSCHYYLDELVDFPIQDSGMQWIADGVAGPAASAPAESLVHRVRDVDTRQQLVSALRDLMVNLEADRVVTYDPTGGYGHPDHIAVHELVMAATSSLTVAVDWLVPPDEDRGSSGVDTCDWQVDGTEWMSVKRAALACYRTQVRLKPAEFALGHDQWWDIAMAERYDTALSTTDHPPV